MPERRLRDQHDLAFGTLTSRELQLDLDVHTGGELKALQGLNGLVGRSEDVDQTLVGAGLELLTGILVLVNSAQDGHDLLLSGERDGTGNASAGTASGLHDLASGLIDQLMIVTLNADTDFFFDCPLKTPP